MMCEELKRVIKKSGGNNSNPPPTHTQLINLFSPSLQLYAPSKKKEKNIAINKEA